jgi:acyl-CoA thioester hydrolase
MGQDRTFRIELETRDYECDLQGIINNAVYFNYFEHTRHKFLRAVGLDFEALHADGIDAVLIRTEMKFKKSLRSGDTFASILTVEPSGRLKLAFTQSIELLPGGELIAESVNMVAFVRNGKPIRRPERVDAAVETWWASG